MDRVVGILEIWRTDDTHEIVIDYCGTTSDVGEPNKGGDLSPPRALLREFAAETRRRSRS